MLKSRKYKSMVTAFGESLCAMSVHDRRNTGKRGRRGRVPEGAKLAFRTNPLPSHDDTGPFMKPEPS